MPQATIWSPLQKWDDQQTSRMLKIRTGLVAHWPLDEAAGAVRKSAIWGSNVPANFDLADHATVAQVAGPSANLPFAAGFTAASSQFNDIADNAPISLFKTDFTVAVWAKETTVTAGAKIAGQWGGAGHRAWALSWNATTQLQFQMTADGTTVTTLNLVSVAATWTLIIITYSAVTGLIVGRSNALALATAAGPLAGPFDSDSAFAVGANAGGSQFNDGATAHLTMWRRVLTDEECLWLYNNGQGRDLRRGC